MPDIFFTLPRELRDTIYDIAYGEERRVTVERTREDYECSEWLRKQRQREDFKPGEEYPESVLSHLLVKKRYFEEASKAWLRSKTFYFVQNFDMDPFVRTDDPIQRFILGSVTKIDVGDSLPHELVELLVRVPALQSLHVWMDVCHMEFAVPGKFPWLDDYTDAELASIPHISNLLCLRGIRNLDLWWNGFSFDFLKPEHRDKWEDFKARAEAFMCGIVSQPREESAASYKAPTLAEALEAKKNIGVAEWADISQTTSPIVEVERDELEDRDIPRTEEQMLRLFLARPTAFGRWIRDAADKGIASTQS